MMSRENGKKQKRTALTIEDKMNIIKLIEKGTSYAIISKRYGIGRSTVCEINKNKGIFKNLLQKMTEIGVKKGKTMKVGSYEKLDDVLYIWFRQ